MFKYDVIYYNKTNRLSITGGLGKSYDNYNQAEFIAPIGSDI